MVLPARFGRQKTLITQALFLLPNFILAVPEFITGFSCLAPFHCLSEFAIACFRQCFAVCSSLDKTGCISERAASPLAKSAVI